jgi:hypothetical protein
MIPNVDLPEGTSGPWSIVRFEVPKTSIENFRLMREGRGCAPGFYTKLVCQGRGVVMSDTSAEKMDHYPFIRNAKGHCLINGLGLGMCLKAALMKPEVEMVTVVEIDRNVIDLVWPHYDSERCQVVQASAFDFKPPKGVRYGAVWHDIWDSICQDNYEEMKRLHRKYGRRSDWQGSWSRPEIERMNRHDRNNPWRW